MQRIKMPARKIVRNAVKIDSALIATAPSAAVAELFVIAANATRETDAAKAADAEVLAYAFNGGAQSMRLGFGREFVVSLDPGYTPPEPVMEDELDDGAALAELVREALTEFDPGKEPSTKDGKQLFFLCRALEDALVSCNFALGPEQDQ